MRLGIGACLLFLGCNNVPAAPTDAASDFTIANEDAGSALDGASDFALANSDGSTSIGASVLQLHNHANRDGVYTDPLLTQSAASRVHRDKAFQGGYAQANARGPVFAQPLFVDQGGSGDFVIVTTESNDVIAFDAISGKSLWHTGSSLLGAAAPGSAFSCGDVNPSGITGTGAIDLPSRTLFFQTDTFDGSQVKHLVWALSIDDGRPRPGWPLDLATVLPNFGAPQQGERGALLILGGNVYVPLGGRYGDCVPYRGYVVGIPMTNPKAAFYFQTKVQDANGDGAGAGIWAPTGLSSDGASLYFATGNSQGTYPLDWKLSDSEGVFRLPTSLSFNDADATSYFAPHAWRALDQGDVDIGGSGVLLVDAPAITAKHLAVVLGKDSNVYLLDRDNLGGITPSDGLFNASVAGGEIINAPASYTTAQGTYVAFKAVCPNGGAPTLNAIRLSAGPSAANAWCANVPGGGSPIVTTTGGGRDTVVWFVSADGEGVTPDYELHGFDGDTGNPIVATEAMTRVERFSSPIEAKGRLYVASDDQLYSFTP